MKRLILLSVLLLAGCLQGPTGPAGTVGPAGDSVDSGPFLVTGGFTDIAIDFSDTLKGANGQSDTIIYFSDISVSLNQKALAVRDRMYSQGGYYLCSDSTIVYGPPIHKVAPNTIFPISPVATKDTLELDGWHLTSMTFLVRTIDALPSHNCTYTLIMR